MGKLLTTVFLFVVYLSRATPQKPPPEDLQLGINMATKVCQGVCWTEYLWPMPSLTAAAHKADKYGPCMVNLNANRLIDIWSAKKYPVKDFDFVKSNVGPNINKFATKYLPEKYTKCTEYMKTPMKKYEKSHPLISDAGKTEYPYAGWCDCMLDTLQSTQGENGIAALKKRWTEPSKWQDVMLERENALRKRHGVEPFVLDDELGKKAQEFADQMVTACSKYADTLSEHDNTLNDEPLGMSIYLWAFGAPSNASVDGLHAINVWYESGEKYPFPEYTGSGDDTEFQTFGQFTQTVWKGTKKAGYGLGKSDKCNYTMIIGKYLPRGNMLGEFKDNVLPATPQ